MMRTHLAKALYWVGGKLSYIKWPTRTYHLELTEGTDFLTRYAGRSWLPNPLSLKCLKWSEAVDPKHWDHWALLHETCDNVPCPDCGGEICR